MARMFETSREGEAGVGLYINSLVSLRTFWPSIWSNPTSLRLTGSTRKAAFLPPSFSPPTFSCGAARSTRSAGWRRLRRLWPNTSPRQLLSQEWTDCARWETGQHQDGDGECKVFLVVYFQLVEIKFLIIIELLCWAPCSPHRPCPPWPWCSPGHGQLRPVRDGLWRERRPAHPEVLLQPLWGRGAVQGGHDHHGEPLTAGICLQAERRRCNQQDSRGDGDEGDCQIPRHQLLHEGFIDDISLEIWFTISLFARTALTKGWRKGTAHWRATLSIPGRRTSTPRGR